ncbi:MAG: hypothetical protein QNK03_26055, partial [Myxococcota bacterium]|nr:hypothetical protein [Myxococcota bacterium]
MLTFHTAHSLALAALLALAGLLVAAPAQAQTRTLLFGSEAERIGDIDPSTGLYTVRCADPSIVAMATRPGTDEVFVVSTGGRLSTVDPRTGLSGDWIPLSANGVPFPDTGSNDVTRVSGITFDESGVLWGIVGGNAGDALPDPGTIFTLDPATGEATDAGFTRAGIGAHSLEFNPDDGLLYHFFNDAKGGNGTSFLRTIDPSTGAASLPFATWGDPFATVNGVVYAGDGEFYVYSYWDETLLSITTSGEARWLQTSVGADATALAFVPGGLESDPEHLAFAGDGQFGTFDPDTGSLSQHRCTGRAYYGLARQPGTNELFAVVDAASAIATVDSASGLVGSPVALTADGVAFADPP